MMKSDYERRSVEFQMMTKKKNVVFNIDTHCRMVGRHQAMDLNLNPDIERIFLIIIEAKALRINTNFLKNLSFEINFKSRR